MTPPEAGKGQVDFRPCLTLPHCSPVKLPTARGREKERMSGPSTGIFKRITPGQKQRSTVLMCVHQLAEAARGTRFCFSTDEDDDDLSHRRVSR